MTFIYTWGDDYCIPAQNIACWSVTTNFRCWQVRVINGTRQYPIFINTNLKIEQFGPKGPFGPSHAQKFILITEPVKDIWVGSVSFETMSKPVSRKALVKSFWQIKPNKYWIGIITESAVMFSSEKDFLEYQSRGVRLCEKPE